jgi:hypothetical protein
VVQAADPSGDYVARGGSFATDWLWEDETEVMGDGREDSSNRLERAFARAGALVSFGLRGCKRFKCGGGDWAGRVLEGAKHGLKVGDMW